MLINCIAYHDGKKVRDISIDEISDYLARPGHFVWVALKDADAAELDVMKAEFGLHELAVEDARHGHQRPKIEEYGDSLFAVVHSAELSGTELLIGEVDIFVEKNFVLSVRNRSQRGFLGVRSRCEREPHLLREGSVFVFYALLDAVVDRYFPVIDALESELEKIEEQIFVDGAERANVERLYQLKRQATVLKHAVAPLLEAVSRLYGSRAPALCGQTQEYFRDVYDHLYRINASIDSIRDTISTAIQVNLSMVNIGQSEVNKRLAAWAAIFAVATALVGIWGMNFKSMPELQWTYGYPFALGIIAAVCGYLHYRFRKSGWL
ncbi:magnesium/cobalt transporter CorA [Noviherbaspirillum suwonense]|uniref:Magnesium transport protein CorA n=1 Tax=Noviherbaspirillum suwonense TaxID=1224511 RepID=A0ABY1Q7T7_9BURK|nr:magnesium/cobalt transporter CorA [Noviherbaspirillum suwonense]SMP59454.1 magnesium transporter [Noviherbaspirillum suwonense]